MPGYRQKSRNSQPGRGAGAGVGWWGAGRAGVGRMVRWVRVVLLVFMGRSGDLHRSGPFTGGPKQKAPLVWHQEGESRQDVQNPRGAPVTATTEITTEERPEAPIRAAEALDPWRFMKLRGGKVLSARCPAAGGRAGRKAGNCTGPGKWVGRILRMSRGLQRPIAKRLVRRTRPTRISFEYFPAVISLRSPLPCPLSSIRSRSVICFCPTAL